MSLSSLDLEDRAFRTVVQHAVDGVLLGAPNGRIFYANPAACSIFGATEEDLCRLGRQGLTEADAPEWVDMLDERRRVGWTKGVGEMFRPDGTSFLAEVSSAIFESSDGEERTCVLLRDVTERVRTERRLVAYDEIVEALLAGADTARVLEMVARHACALFDANFACITVPAESGEGVTISAAHGRGASRLVGRSYPPGSLSEEVMRSAEAVLLQDTVAAGTHQDGRDLNLGSGMLVPIMSEVTALGTLFVGARRGRHPYKSDDLANAAQYALRAGIALAMGDARAGAEAALRDTAEHLQRALDSRVVIEQAKGFLACLHHISVDDAFDRLRKYARSHSTDIHTIALRVIRRELIL
jgi:PAS domain S-box-containing protein